MQHPSPELRDPRFARAVQEVLAADATFDAPRFAALFSERGTFQLGGNPPAEGRAAIEAVVRGFFSSGLLRAMHHELLGSWEQGDTLIYQAKVHYTLHDGRELTLPYVNVLRFEGELVADYRVFIDLSPLQALAPRQPEPHFPVVVRFEVSPERQHELVEAIRAFNLEFVRHQDGFEATNLYVSHDRRQVINFGAWRDQAAYEAFLARAPAAVPAIMREFPYDSRAHTLAFQVRPPREGEKSP